jgi:hypothetical protein
MLTAIKLKTVLQELLATNEIGCTYDFIERHGLALSSLETLGYVKVIRSRIPACGDHCEKFNDCQHISLFEKRKSKSKYKLQEKGIKLLKRLDMLSTEEDVIEEVKNELMLGELFDIIQSLLLDAPEGLTVEQLVTSTLKQTKLSLTIIRTTFKDIIDLLFSVGLLAKKEGILSTYAQK